MVWYALDCPIPHFGIVFWRMKVCIYMPRASSKLRLCIAGQRTGVFIHNDIAALLTIAEEDNFNSEIIPKYDKYKIDVRRNG